MTLLKDDGKYSKIYIGKYKNGRIRDNVNKIALAKKIVEKSNDIKIYDLQKKMRTLIEFIKESN